MYPAVLTKPYPTDQGYSELVTARKFWRASYTGGRKYRHCNDAYGDSILLRHESETDASYARRLKASPVHNYTGPILRRYNDFIFRRNPDTPDYDIGSLYDTLVEDVDGNGTSLFDFYRSQLLHAQIDGVSYALITSNKPRIDVEISLAAARVSGYRMFLQPIKANAVVWTHYEGQALTECAVLMQVDGSQIVRHYDDVYQTDYILDDKGAQIVANGEQVEHGIAGLPVVDLLPMFAGEQESQSSDIAEAQKVNFNLNSLLTEEMYANTFTQWVLAGVSPDDARDAGVEMGSKRIFCLPNPSASLNRIGSDPTQAESIRTTISAETRELYRAAGVGDADPTIGGNPESGIAKAFKFNDLAANLSALADATQSSINTALSRVYATLEEDYPGDAVFPDDFAPPDFGAELVELVSALSASSLPQVVKQNLSDRFISRNITLSAEDELLYEMQRESIGQSPLATFGEGIRQAVSTSP